MKICESELHASLARALEKYDVPGASAAVFQGGEVTKAAAGVTNITTGVELTPETVMHIGSITKVFTATLVMQLVDRDQVDLDERVAHYLPELKLGDKDALKHITVKMLLNHTSGIDGDFMPDHGHDEETIEKAIQRYAALGQLFHPGTEFSYCNAATVIAGYLVQRLTGTSWYRLVRERILEPLSMQHAAVLPEEAILHRASVGHYVDPHSRKAVRTSSAYLPLSVAPAGSTLMMGAHELLMFAEAHMALGLGGNGARILSARSAGVMQRLSVDNTGKGYTYVDGMGLGWMMSHDGLLQHSGGAPGACSVLYAHPSRRWAAAILTNSENGYRLIVDLMLPWLKELGAETPYGASSVEGPQRDLEVVRENYVGVYEDIVIRYRVSLSQEGLQLSRQLKCKIYENVSMDAMKPVPLRAVGRNQFVLDADWKDSDLPPAFRTYTFRNPDSDGRMRHLGFGLRLYPRIA